MQEDIRVTRPRSKDGVSTVGPNSTTIALFHIVMKRAGECFDAANFGPNSTKKRSPPSLEYPEEGALV